MLSTSAAPETFVKKRLRTRALLLVAALSSLGMSCGRTLPVKARPVVVVDAGVQRDAGVRPVFDAGQSVDAGVITAGTCNSNDDCRSGFSCMSGVCVLNGGSGELQFTLRWSANEDFDLHVVEPGGCEVYWDNTQCLGALDLDSLAGCTFDSIRIENVIYPSGVRRRGHYVVRVDHFENCSDSLDSATFEVIVRRGAVVEVFSGAVQRGSPFWSSGGTEGAGQTIFEFDF